MRIKKQHTSKRRGGGNNSNNSNNNNNNSNNSNNNNNSNNSNNYNNNSNNNNSNNNNSNENKNNREIIDPKLRSHITYLSENIKQISNWYNDTFGGWDVKLDAIRKKSIETRTRRYLIRTELAQYHKMITAFLREIKKEYGLFVNDREEFEEWTTHRIWSAEEERVIRNTLQRFDQKATDMSEIEEYIEGLNKDSIMLLKKLKAINRIAFNTVNNTGNRSMMQKRHYTALKKQPFATRKNRTNKV